MSAGWHRDIGPHGFGGRGADARLAYRESQAHAYVCSFHYLTDVTPDSPCFAVIPQSCVFESADKQERLSNIVGQLKDHLGDAYQELLIYAKAGTCAMYDISLYHSRVNATGGARNRRALQTYYSRGDVPALTNWVILPKRLAEHPEREARRFYSLQREVDCQKRFEAIGYDRQSLTREEQDSLRTGEYAHDTYAV